MKSRASVKKDEDLRLINLAYLLLRYELKILSIYVNILNIN